MSPPFPSRAGAVPALEAAPGPEVVPAPAGGQRIPAARVTTSWILGLSVAAVIASGLQLASGQAEHGFFLLSICFVVCFAAAWSDVATRRIPNVLTYPAILLGLSLNGVAPLFLAGLGLQAANVWVGSSGTADCFQGFGLCALIGIVSFMARGLGGGDVKLLAAAGALLGFAAVIPVLFNTLLVAAFIGIVNWVAGGQLMGRVQSLAHAVYFSFLTKSDMRVVYRFRPTEGPFALSLLIGLVSAQFIALHRVIFSVAW